MLHPLRFWVFCLFVAFGIAGSIQAQNSPQEVVEAFLTAWNAQDYATMYNYIHPESQEQYDATAFAEQYTMIANTLQLTGVSYTIQNVHLQGETAAVTYDAVLESVRFGTIADAGRIMRIVNTPEGWKIAWSTMDIFDTLLDAELLQVQAQPRQRAAIYDRNGLVLAADGGTTVALYSQQQRMADPSACIWLLGEIGRIPILRLERRFAELLPDTIFFLAEIPLEIYEEQSAALNEICGVGQTNADVFLSAPQRTYYLGNGVAHVAGYMRQVNPEEQADYGAGALVGDGGIEGAYQDILAGEPEKVIRIIDPQGIELREFAGASGRDPAPVITTIDRNLQHITVQALSDAFNYATPNWGSVSTGGAAVVLDVHTGAILALVSYPLFNPNLFNPASMTSDIPTALDQQVYNHPLSPLSNRVTQEQYFPGSVYKIVTLAAILNEGLIAPGETFYCDLEWHGQEFDDTLERRRDWRVIDDMPAAGDVTPAEALMTSCDPFFYQYGALLFRDVGSETLTNYARRMGLGRTYGINGVLIEAPGLLPIPDSAEDAINEAIGQGDVAVSPLQMAVAVAAVANGGIVYRPYLVQQVGGMDGAPITETAEPEILRQLDFNPGVLEAIQEGMCGVVNNEELGTAWGRFHNWPPHGYVDITANYTVCGKTGTASTDLYPHAWFVAYAPAENPEIAIVVMVEQSREGSQIAAPIVRRILDDYFGEPRAAFPDWWQQSYLPLEVPEDVGSG